MNKLPEFAMRHKSVVITCVVLLVSWGAIAFFTMPRREDPEFTIMTCVVTTEWPGAPAVKVEELVTDPIEDTLDGIEEVDVVRSTSINGQSTVYVDLEDDTSPDIVDQVWDQVRARVQKVRMPEPDIKPVVNDSFGDTSIILFAIHQVPLPGETEINQDYEYTDRELDIYSDRVRDALRLLPGVATVDRFGVQEEVIYIETDAGTWSQLQINSDQLEQLVSSRNIIAAGGALDTDDGRFYVKPGGELNAVDELSSLVAGLAESGDSANQVYLQDLGLRVRRGYRDPSPLLCRFGDVDTARPCIVVALTMKSGANIVTICDAAKQRVEELKEVQQALPDDIATTLVSDQSLSVNARIKDVVINVVEAILIVVIVVYLVVGLKTALVMAANIPFVVISSIGIITFFDVQLEQMSLASMIIALGLLVDNAVQVCDQSRTNQIEGMGPVEGTVAGAKVLAMPMLNGTLTTIAAFIPMLIALDGSTREFIYSLPITLSTMLAVSWLLAMTFCVILASAFIRPPKDPSKPDAPLARLAVMLRSRARKPGQSSDAAASTSESFVSQLYGGIALFAVKRKFLTITVSVALLVVALGLPVATEFFPQNERDQFAIEVWLPDTANIEQTDEAARAVEEIIRELSPTEFEGESVEQLHSMRTVVGGGGSRWYLSWDPESRRPNFAEILVRTTHGRFTSEFVSRIREVAERGDKDLGLSPVTGARIVPIELMLGPPADPVTLRVIGSGFANIKMLRSVAERTKAVVAAQPETWNIHDSWGVDGFQLNIDVDEDRANLAGVSNAQIAGTLDAYFSGKLLSTFREGDHQVPVYFRLDRENRNSLAHVRTAFVEGNSGKVPLEAIADLDARWEPGTIERRDLNRTIEVRARVEPGVSGNDVVKRIMGSQEMKDLQDSLPGGFWIEIGGALEESQKGTAKMLRSFGISFLAIIMLLVIQFNSVSKTMIIVGTLPLALIGAIGGLWLTDNPLGFMPQLGILSLFGIVLNTGIIFIEFADMLIRRKRDQSDGDGPIVGLTREDFRECLVDAGKQRLLPIFLTTATTVGGLIPLALAGGPLWVGMSWLMIFGLLVATLLTLLVVPALYAIFVETLRVKPVESANA